MAQGGQALTSNYATAAQPLQTNFGTSQAGVNQLGNLLGVNGASGNASAMSTLQNTPGYQFALDQGNQGVLRNQAATGMLASGNTDADLDKYSQGLASQTYQNSVQNLQPYLGLANSSASGLSSLYQGLGQNLNANQNTLAGIQYGGATSQGNALGNADLAAQQASKNLWGAVTGGVGGLLNFGGSSGAGSAAGGAVGSAASGIGNLIAGLF